MGTGVPEILEAIVARLPPPAGNPDAPLKALIFDSRYDPYRGVVIVVRVIDGTLRPGMRIRLMAEGQDYDAEQVGIFSPKAVVAEELGVGEVGFLVANIKKISDAKIGDTVTEAARPALEPFPGFKELKPMVFAGLYPVEGHKYSELRDALEKLRLNDASFFYEPETSVALGFGFRCGFLGLLHMEIVQERLEREFDQDLITTAPGVLYRVTTTDDQVEEIDSPAKLPDAGRIKVIEEPVITAMILTPAERVGPILELCQEPGRAALARAVQDAVVAQRGHGRRRPLVHAARGQLTCQPGVDVVAMIAAGAVAVDDQRPATRGRLAPRHGQGEADPLGPRHLRPALLVADGAAGVLVRRCPRLEHRQRHPPPVLHEAFVAGHRRTGGGPGVVAG